MHIRKCIYAGAYTQVHIRRCIHAGAYAGAGAVAGPYAGAACTNEAWAGACCIGKRCMRLAQVWGSGRLRRPLPAHTCARLPPSCPPARTPGPPFAQTSRGTHRVLRVGRSRSRRSGVGWSTLEARWRPRSQKSPDGCTGLLAPAALHRASHHVKRTAPHRWTPHQAAAGGITKRAGAGAKRAGAAV